MRSALGSKALEGETSFLGGLGEVSFADSFFWLSFWGLGLVGWHTEG